MAVPLRGISAQKDFCHLLSISSSMRNFRDFIIKPKTLDSFHSGGAAEAAGALVRRAAQPGHQPVRRGAAGRDGGAERPAARARRPAVRAGALHRAAAAPLLRLQVPPGP